MTKVFIGGSRRVSRLDAEVRRRLDRIVEKRLPVVVGDANGADKAVQRYLQAKAYDRVEVFCMEGACRNNLGRWPARSVSANGAGKGFDFYATKDRAMAQEASVGLMIWDGKSAGTLANVFRLAALGRKVVLYDVSSKAFFDIVDQESWDRFFARCGADLRDRIKKISTSEAKQAAGARQISLFQPEPLS